MTSRRESHELEEGDRVLIDFDKVATVGGGGHRVVPVALFDVDAAEVLFIGYANREALAETLATGEAVLYSTSRQELWHKGATSGDRLQIVDVRVNCEQNSLLYRVRRLGAGVCHTRNPDGDHRTTCYYRRVVTLDELDT